jgi:hypothetical protein
MSYRIAGIDVHKKMLAVVVADVEVEGEYEFERRRYGSNPEQLRVLAEWGLKWRSNFPEGRFVGTNPTDEPITSGLLKITGPNRLPILRRGFHHHFFHRLLQQPHR